MFQEMKGVQFVEWFPYLNKLTGDRKYLVVIDDLMMETDDRVTRLFFFTKGSHHHNFSVMYNVQNLYGKSKHQINLSSQYIVLLKKNPLCLAKQMYPGRTSYVQNSIKDVTSVPHGYFLIDLRQETPNQLRLQSNIFPHELQVVFIPKQRNVCLFPKT